jgi:CheY-like chemotaxis protein
MQITIMLLADNDHEFLETRCEFFQRAGFVVQATAEFVAALQFLKQGDLDIAVLDMRLVNDEDEQDHSGLDLAAQVAPTVPKIILTRYPSYAAVKQALAPQLNGLPPAVDFVPKQDGPDVLLTAVRKALTKRIVQPPKHLRPRLPTRLASIIPKGPAHVVGLRRRLTTEFDLEELRTLCFDLKINFDDLRGEGKDAKARELVMYCQRREMLGRLGAAIRRERGER